MPGHLGRRRFYLMSIGTRWQHEWLRFSSALPGSYIYRVVCPLGNHSPLFFCWWAHPCLAVGTGWYGAIACHVSMGVFHSISRSSRSPPVPSSHPDHLFAYCYIQHPFGPPIQSIAMIMDSMLRRGIGGDRKRAQGLL